MNRARYTALITLSSVDLLEALDKDMPDDTESYTEVSIFLDSLNSWRNMYMVCSIQSKSVLDSLLGQGIRVHVDNIKRISGRFSASVNLYQLLRALRDNAPSEIDLVFYKDVLIIKESDNKTKSIWEHVIACSLKK